ncbi:hypothetical protein PRZ48_006451 [Zasmidium cellare]|uniref:Uncharacterized protein n=1 Tax=Zasmidium cellare TaxID=395010 RepID=A0ABR0ENS9_ZASCE|nr:hypothetical protein PRZ48_006451 [Zasmidium cellare]
MPEYTVTQPVKPSKGGTSHNCVSVGGKDYRIEGQIVDEAFVKDMFEMEALNFVEKYGLREWESTAEDVNKESK